MLVTTLERLLYVTTTSFKPSKTFTKLFLEGLNTPSVENNCEITVKKCKSQLVLLCCGYEKELCIILCWAQVCHLLHVTIITGIRSDELSSFCIFLLHLLHATYIDVESTPTTRPSTLNVIESSETVKRWC